MENKNYTEIIEHTSIKPNEITLIENVTIAPLGKQILTNIKYEVGQRQSKYFGNNSEETISIPIRFDLTFKDTPTAKCTITLFANLKDVQRGTFSNNSRLGQLLRKLGRDKLSDIQQDDEILSESNPAGYRVFIFD